MKHNHRSYYLNFVKNIVSQNGEDGVIEKLFKDLKINNGVLCEFGAWDGVWLSNIANLYLKNEDYHAILIESDSFRVSECLNLLENYDNVEIYECTLSPNVDSETSIDNILARSSFDLSDDNFSLMSIDIDTCDYYIFESLQKYKPKVVIVETNGLSQDPNNEKETDWDYEYVSYNSGCTLKSVTKLAESKGYTLVVSTGNAFFVRNDLIDKLPKKDYSLKNLYVPISEILRFNSSCKSDGSIGEYDFSKGENYHTSSEYRQFISEVKNKLLNGKKLTKIENKSNKEYE